MELSKWQEEPEGTSSSVNFDEWILWLLVQVNDLQQLNSQLKRVNTRPVWVVEHTGKEKTHCA